MQEAGQGCPVADLGGRPCSCTGMLQGWSYSWQLLVKAAAIGTSMNSNTLQKGNMDQAGWQLSPGPEGRIPKYMHVSE